MTATGYARTYAQWLLNHVEEVCAPLTCMGGCRLIAEQSRVWKRLLGFARLLGAAIRLHMGWRWLVGYHPGGEAIGVGLRLRPLQVLEGLFAGFPGPGRDRLQELVVGAVDLVHHMRARQDAVERDTAAQRAFAHINELPMRPATSPKGDFQVKAAVAGAHGVGAVELGGAAVMSTLPSPLLFCRLSLVVEVLIRQLLAGAQLVLGRIQDRLQERVAIEREGSAPRCPPFRAIPVTDRPGNPRRRLSSVDRTLA